MAIPRVSQPDAWRRAGAKHLLPTSRNTTPESAEAIVVKALAKAKLQFPVITEKFE